MIATDLNHACQQAVKTEMDQTAVIWAGDLGFDMSLICRSCKDSWDGYGWGTEGSEIGED